MSRSDRILIAAAAGAVVLALAAVAMLLIPVEANSGASDPSGAAFPFGSPQQTEMPAASATRSAIIVDVEGAVAEPGIRELPAGSRVADAIAAAGGYASDADLAAASAAINLAQALSDGEQVVVPRIGDATAGAPSGPAAGSATSSEGGGMVDLNSATPEELEALPGIGAVTVQKIVAARQERPFASLEDAVERGVINRGQLEDLQGLATAG